MIYTIQQYKKALYKAAEHAEKWNRMAKSSCEDNYTCPVTSFE